MQSYELKTRRVPCQKLHHNLLANFVLSVGAPVEHHGLPSACEVGRDSSPGGHLRVPGCEEREGFESRGGEDEETEDDVKKCELGEGGLDHLTKRYWISARVRPLERKDEERVKSSNGLTFSAAMKVPSGPFDWERRYSY